jgi:hypothetical protein
MKFHNTLRDNKGFFRTSYTNSEGKRMWVSRLKYIQSFDSCHFLFSLSNERIRLIFSLLFK